jgi:hypothetical protein
MKVERESPREMARFLQNAGSLVEELAPGEEEFLREIIARRAEGASDEDLQGVTDAIPLPSREEMIRLHNETHHHHHHGHEHKGLVEQSPSARPFYGGATHVARASHLDFMLRRSASLTPAPSRRGPERSGRTPW